MTLDPHVMTFAVATLGVGWLMAYAGLPVLRPAHQRPRLLQLCLALSALFSLQLLRHP